MRKHLFILMLLLLACIPTAFSITNYTLSEEQSFVQWDTYVFEADPTNNFRNAGTVQIHSRPGLRQRGYWALNYTNTTGTIVNASLCINPTTFSSHAECPVSNFKVRFFTGNINSPNNTGESTINWNNQHCGINSGSPLDGDVSGVCNSTVVYEILGNSTPNQYYCIDVTQKAQNIINRSFIVAAYPTNILLGGEFCGTTGGATASFASKQTTNSSLLPYLFLQTEPIFAAPNITILEPSNNTVFNKSIENLTYESFCYDENGLNFSLNMKNSSNTIYSAYNDTFTSFVSTLNGVIDLKNVSIGEYTLNFTCRNIQFTQEIDIVGNVTQTLPKEPVLHIIPIYPSSGLNVTDHIVPFNVSVNITSSCLLYINGSSYGLQPIAAGGTVTHSTNALNNGSYQYFYACNLSKMFLGNEIQYYFNSSLINFMVQEYATGTPVVSGGGGNTTVNVISSTDLGPLVDALIILLLFMVAGGILAMGKTFKSGLTGVVGSFVLMFAAFKLAPYSAGAAVAIVLLSFLLMWYFIENGRKMNL